MSVYFFEHDGEEKDTEEESPSICVAVQVILQSELHGLCEECRQRGGVREREKETGREMRAGNHTGKQKNVQMYTTTRRHTCARAYMHMRIVWGLM